MTPEQIANYQKGSAFRDYIKARKLIVFNTNHPRHSPGLNKAILARLEKKAERLVAEFPDFPKAFKELI